MRLPYIVGLLLVGGCLNSNEPGDGIVARTFTVGETAACALNPQGKTYCWGQNSAFLEFASATVPASNTVPIEIPVPKLLSLSSGKSQHRCGLTGDGAVCWGRGANGQLGNGTLGNTGNPPTTVLGSEAFVDISTGRLTSCALDSSGDAYCWGLNQRGEVGDTLLTRLSPGNRVTTPNKVVGGIKFATIVAGWLHTCGIATSGAAYCWGDNRTGQIGIGKVETDTSVVYRKPTAVATTMQFKSISLSARGTCAITVDGQLFCWGYNGTGQLGVGDTAVRSLPTAVAPTRRFKSVSMGSGFPTGTTSAPVPTVDQGGVAHTCAIDDQDAVWCWGWNGAGQVGDATTTDRLTPVALSSTLKFTTILLGASTSCGVSGTAIYCWGSNSFGQLGNGGTSDSFTPVKVQIPW
jgi:alpha-tubulin suppressor-like RCC1 family protein